MSGAALAAAAAALVGTPFRLNGRDRATGLDCVGLIEVALVTIGKPAGLPRGYRLRNVDIGALLPDLRNYGLTPIAGAIEPGDVVMLRPGPGQYHFAVALGDGCFVHAHAGLRRVVAQPGAALGAPLRHWRLLS